jgi:hypothetical protein
MRVGIIIRQGGQLVEEISRITGLSEFKTSFSKLLSLILMILISSISEFWFLE